MRVLVSGASGFVGSLIIPALIERGYEVRALAREPGRVRAGDAGVEVVRADAFTGEGLHAAFAGIDVAYYLIHSMERSPVRREPFHERERITAERFATGAADAGVRRIVYLGGLLPRTNGVAGAPTGAGGDESPGRHARAANGALLSPHLASRASVERMLMSAVPNSVALRASIVIGARSRSFRLLVRLIERMPAIALPAWRSFRTAPIDERDVRAMLIAAASADVGGRTLDIAGPHVLTYGEMVRRIAELMLISRRSLGVRASLTGITARVAAAITREDPELVLALMQSLGSDLLPADDGADRLLDVPLHSFDAAVEHALRRWEETEPLAAR